MPTISVIVPVYKVEPYIHRCVDSILNQTYRDFELILVDDGSPDNCGAICDEYAEKDDRVVVIHQENGGLSAARNAGIDWAFANSDSEWLTFVDSDDWVHQEYLKTLHSSAITSNAEMGVCRYRPVSDPFNNNYSPIINLKLHYFNAEEYIFQEEKNSVVSALAKIYKKNLFHHVRYPLGKIHEDVFTTYKLLFTCKTIVLIDTAMYYYYQSPNSIIRSAWTPGRLDEITGFEELISFLRKNKYIRLKKKYIRVLFTVFLNQGYSLNQLGNPAYRKYYHKLRIKIVLYWIRHINILCKFFQTDIWAFEKLFPRFMSLYWYSVVVKNKISACLRLK